MTTLFILTSIIGWCLFIRERRQHCRDLRMQSLEHISSASRRYMRGYYEGLKAAVRLRQKHEDWKSLARA